MQFIANFTKFYNYDYGLSRYFPKNIEFGVCAVEVEMIAFEPSFLDLLDEGAIIHRWPYTVSILAFLKREPEHIPAFSPYPNRTGRKGLHEQILKVLWL